MNALIDHLTKDAPEYTVIAGLLSAAAVANMPTPEVMEKLLGDGWLFVAYKWLYDTLQAFMAARNPHTGTASQQVSAAGAASKSANESADAGRS